jgi:hypothetical protein
LNSKKKRKYSTSIITFFHDIEQDYDSQADPKACRQMVDEFLQLEKKYNVPATYNVVGKIFNKQPELIESISQAGQEVAFHSYNHQTDWKKEYYSDEIELCRRVSSIPVGYRSPRSQISESAIKTIWEKGFLWNAEGDYHKEPYFIYKGLVRLPISGDDWPLYLGKVSADEWVLNFSKLLKSRTYIAFGLHDYIATVNPEKTLRAWEMILQIATDSKALLLNFSETAELFRRTAMYRYLQNNRRESKSSKYFMSISCEEIIKKEAEKLGNPVIANLFFVNNKLPLSLKEFAKVIYNIPVDSDLISEYTANEYIEVIENDISELKSKNNFTDLVICLNNIEYQFSPNHIADEIKRICKIGATFIVTFPAVNANNSYLDGSVPGRIKHIYTQNEILSWSEQIGPGHIIIIDDIIAQNDMDNNGKGILISEKKVYPHKQTTNMVFIGTVQNKYIHPKDKRIIHVSGAFFGFPNPVYEKCRIFIERIGINIMNPIRKVAKYFISLVKNKSLLVILFIIDFLSMIYPAV